MTLSASLKASRRKQALGGAESAVVRTRSNLLVDLRSYRHLRCAQHASKRPFRGDLLLRALRDAQRLSARPDGRQASVVVQLLQQHFSRALMSGDDLGSVVSRPCQAWLWRCDRAIVLRGSGVTLQLALLLDLAQELLLLLERAAQPLRRLAVARCVGEQSARCYDC